MKIDLSKLIDKYVLYRLNDIPAGNAFSSCCGAKKYKHQHENPRTSVGNGGEWSCTEGNFIGLTFHSHGKIPEYLQEVESGKWTGKGRNFFPIRDKDFPTDALLSWVDVDTERLLGLEIAEPSKEETYV